MKKGESIQDIRMIDWYAAFILMKLSTLDNTADWTASEVFDRAQAMIDEREKRIDQVKPTRGQKNPSGQP